METGKRFRTNFIILSLGYIILGTIRLIVPDANTPIISYLLGALALVAGLVRIAFYFIKDDGSRVFRNDLAIGVILLIAGVYLIALPAALLLWLPVIVGFSIVFDSVLKLQYSFELKRTDFQYWWVLLLIAALTAVLGTLLIIGPFEGNFLLIYFGVTAIIDGVANLAALILLSLHLKKQNKQNQK